MNNRSMVPVAFDASDVNMTPLRICPPRIMVSILSIVNMKFEL